MPVEPYKFEVGDKVKLLIVHSYLANLPASLADQYYVIEARQPWPDDNDLAYLVTDSKMGKFWPREFELQHAEPCYCNPDNKWQPSCFECMERIYP